MEEFLFLLAIILVGIVAMAFWHVFVVLFVLLAGLRLALAIRPGWLVLPPSRLRLLTTLCCVSGGMAVLGLGLRYLDDLPAGPSQEMDLPGVVIANAVPARAADTSPAVMLTVKNGTADAVLTDADVACDLMWGNGAVTAATWAKIGQQPHRDAYAPLPMGQELSYQLDLKRADDPVDPPQMAQTGMVKTALAQAACRFVKTYGFRPNPNRDGLELTYTAPSPGDRYPTFFLTNVGASAYSGQPTVSCVHEYAVASTAGGKGGLLRVTRQQVDHDVSSGLLTWVPGTPGPEVTLDAGATVGVAVFWPDEAQGGEYALRRMGEDQPDLSGARRFAFTKSLVCWIDG